MASSYRLFPFMRPRLSWLLVALLATATRSADEVSEPSPSGPAETLASLQSKVCDLLPSHPGLAEPPTIILAGHLNAGKSSVLQALLQLPLVPVGTSSMTRRPIHVHCQHDPACDEPAIFLRRDPDASEERQHVADVRAFVEAENARLAQSNDVDATPIHLRVRWKLAPNVVLVDTPGLLSVPADMPMAQDAVLARTSVKAEQILLDALKASPARLCLCLEDTADWQLCPTAAVVRRADPDLGRTILVATKLDGKLKQFSSPEDLHRLLNPGPALRQHAGSLLGGPIFTCIPPVRGDPTSMGALAECIAREEAHNRNLLSERTGSGEYASSIGVHALRACLQPHIDQRWSELLQAAVQASEGKVAELQRAMDAPSDASEAEDLSDFAHRFSNAIKTLIDGCLSIPIEVHGETLEQEQAASSSGAFCELRTPSAAARKAAADGLAQGGGGLGRRAGGGEGAADAAADAAAADGADASDDDVAALWLNAGLRLFGGSQYERAMHEFMVGASQAKVDGVSIEEIVNAMGVDSYHDGANLLNAVCVLVVEKARGFFDEALAKLRLRMLHIMARLGPQAEALMLTEAARYYSEPDAPLDGDGGLGDGVDGGGDGALPAPGRASARPSWATCAPRRRRCTRSTCRSWPPSSSASCTRRWRRPLTSATTTSPR